MLALDNSYNNVQSVWHNQCIVLDAKCEYRMAGGEFQERGKGASSVMTLVGVAQSLYNTLKKSEGN